MPKALTGKQEAFAKEVVLNGGNKVAAYKAAGYAWENMTSNSLSVAADKLYNSTKVLLRINDLQAIADKRAENEFSISVDQRLRWLHEITTAGLGEYHDPAGNARRENLTAATGAIKTMNEMLGVRGEEEGADALNITFTVSQPVGDIKVTRGN